MPDFITHNLWAIKQRILDLKGSKVRIVRSLTLRFKRLKLRSKLPDHIAVHDGDLT